MNIKFNNNIITFGLMVKFFVKVFYDKVFYVNIIDVEIF